MKTLFVRRSRSVLAAVVPFFQSKVTLYAAAFAFALLLTLAPSGAFAQTPVPLEMDIDTDTVMTNANMLFSALSGILAIVIGIALGSRLISFVRNIF